MDFCMNFVNFCRLRKDIFVWKWIFSSKNSSAIIFFSENANFSSKMKNLGFWYNIIWYNSALQKNMTHCEWLL